jgi:GH24 family phage-related lysozyme (muramidase)
VPESVIDVNIRLEQSAKALNDAVDKAVRLEQTLASVTRRMGENNQATKTTKLYYDKATEAAQKLWATNQREMNKIDPIVKRIGDSIDKSLIQNVNKLGEAVDRAGQRFDTSITSRLKKIQEEYKKIEEAKKRAEKDPVLSHMQRWRVSDHPSAEAMYQSANLKRPWKKPSIEEGQFTAKEQLYRLFVQARQSGAHHDALRMVGGISSSGSPHVTLISGLTSLMRNFLNAPSGMQLLIGVATGIIASGAAAIALSPIVTRRQRAARGAGLAYGQFESAENTYGPYYDAKQAIGASASAQDPTSQQYIAMMQLGLRPSANAANDIDRQNIALKEMISKFSDFGQFLATLHNTPLGSMITDERARTVASLPMARLQELAKQEENDAKQNKIDEKTSEIYVKLYADMNRFGTALETVTIKNLAGFASGLDSILNKLVSWLQSGYGPGQSFPTVTSSKDQENVTKMFGKPSSVPTWGSPTAPSGAPKRGFATGAYNVPDDGTAMLHQNELVMPAKEASAFRDMLNNSTTEGGKDFGEFNRELMKSSDIIVKLSSSMEDLNSEIESGKYLAQNYGGGQGGTGTTVSGGGGTAVGTGGGGGSGPHSPSSSSGGGATVSSGASADMSGGAGSFIKHQEGLSLKQYMDAGHKAIGYGHDFTAAELAQGYAVGASGEHISTSGSITKEQADSLFTADYQSRFKDVASKVPGFDKLNSNQQEAIMSYKYNTGRLPSNLAGNIASGNMSGISASLAGGIKTSQGVYNAGLDRRRQQEASLFNSTPTAATSTGGGGGSPATNMPDLSDSKDWSEHLANMKKNNLLTNEQCVTLAMASAGVKYGSGQAGGHTTDWRRGDSVTSGNIQPGTPISTFAGLHGEQNQNIYAGGTGGRAKVGLDHAGIFESYIRDKNGQIIGMNMADQWKGSGGIHDKHAYMFGGGKGEHDARNYSAIKLANDEYLGGKNNPMEKMRDIAKAYDPNKQSQQAATAITGRVDPYGKTPTPHMGDMSQYHKDSSPNVTIFNKSGANYNLQTASLGAAQGNFDA